MERIKSYNDLREEVEILNEQIAIHEALHAAGVPYSLTRYFVHVAPARMADSGYQMGEVIYVCCRGEQIARYDKTREYAPSCKWNARHGLIIFDFKSKGALRKLCDACMRYALKDGAAIAEAAAVRAILRDALDLEASEINKKFNPDRII